MAYKKQNFKNDQILDADQLNHIEDGIVELEEKINEIPTGGSIEGITLGIHTDGALYIFKDGVPVGTGIILNGMLGTTEGFIDVDNNIFLPDNFVSGTYTLKYENEDNTYTVIGQFNIPEEGE